MRRFLAVIPLAVGSVLGACGGDAATTEPVPVIAESSAPSTVGTSSVVQGSVDSPSEASVPLLIDALPDLDGPTVLWFWAPG